MKATVVVLQTRNPAFARASFLTNSWQVCQNFLENAFIFESVQWQMIQPLIQTGKNPKLHSLFRQHGSSWADFFTNHFKWTLLPFDLLPAPLGFSYTNTDIQRLTTTAVQRGYGQNSTASWEGKAGAILLDRLHTVRLKMRGEVYLTPCEGCKAFFSHLAGQCRLIDIPQTGGERARVNLCHMPLFERSDALPENPEEAPTDAMGPVTLD